MSRISHLPSGAVGLCVQGSWTSLTPREEQVQACTGEELANPTEGFFRLKGRKDAQSGRMERSWPPGGGDLCSVGTQ